MTGHIFTLEGEEKADPALHKIDTVVGRVEQALLDGYRRLLKESYSQSEQWCRLPEGVAGHFRRLLKGLQSGLFSSIHDTANLQIVSDYHEELRIRLMMLEHLVDREVPWVYLERALNCVLEKVVLLDRDASNTSQTAVVALPQVSARVSVWREKPVWWRRLFAGNRASRSASKKPRQSLAVRASAAACQRFERLPEYLKRLSLIYHFMEMDDLNLLDKMRLVPSLGRHFSLQGTIAVFDAEDLGECFWGERLRQGSSEPIAKTVEELKEKLRKKGYHEGVSSSFTASAEGESREQRSPPTQMLA